MKQVSSRFDVFVRVNTVFSDTIKCFFLYVCIFVCRAVVPIHSGGRRCHTAPRKALTSVLNSFLSLIATISSGSSFQRREVDAKDVLLWPSVLEIGIITAAVR